MSHLPICSAIVVNYNGLRYLKECLESLQQLDYPRDCLDLILVDNGSSDDSLDYVRQTFPEVRLFINSENNFAKALNLGIQHSKGEYIAFINNDAALDSQWLSTLLRHFNKHSNMGTVGGKIKFKDGRINSVGHRQLPNYFWDDIGLGEPDKGQYDRPREVEGLCWAAALFRKACLVDVGAVDEAFVMYFEDVDYAQRCREKGWKLGYVPEAIAYHVHGGSSQGNTLTEYFCNRNRFLYLAKHEPEQFVEAIETSVFTKQKQYERLFDALLAGAQKLWQHHDLRAIEPILERLQVKLIELYPHPVPDRFCRRLQSIAGDCKLSIYIYDHALHFVGGGQKYVATLASILQHQFDITFIGNKPVTISDLETWYGLNLSRCHLKIIPLSFFEKRRMANIDSSMVSPEMENPFDPISKESEDCDIFINVNQLEKVQPKSPISIFFCHFPDSWRNTHFAVDDYTFLIANSHFTIKWLKRRWNLEPTFLLYPPVDMTTVELPKEKIILSVARFEAGGSKKQIEEIEAFLKLRAVYPTDMEGWRLVLVGGSTPGNPYLKTVLKRVQKSEDAIVVLPNVSSTELKSWYARASIFWHACGLGEVNPQRCEHFGMATVEAMQNYCVPITFNGGGQPEIIEAGQSGFLFDTTNRLCEYTHELAVNPDRLSQMQNAAFDRGRQFSIKPFAQKVKAFFSILDREYRTVPLPDPAEVRMR
ncbi:glycosyltransferase [Oscillatoriales cyanobacterium LEGE 11467]|uniref:Glycosyltransferase n=1 Tax=Zarconia navalis LEGE 11467 TaxID=1828826 RepID=A0A928W1T9_9CYAN|nr:glycosyltransferase [Zarconia navalis]MBE9041685.1 glycosyltransferase [Zarconia navalis LEGE 11467]